MKIYSIILFLLISCAVQAQTNTEVYLFSYFKGNGEDGLHLAYSDDGYRWQSLRHDSSFLRPTAGKDKLMRDPCIVQSPDGTFHMVWTVSWNERGIGYAHSKDLIHWSEQQYIPVMEHEQDARNCWAPEIFYDAASKQFMIYWATTITGRYPETQSAKEDFYNHRMYYVTTKDFKTFSKTALLYNKDFNVIDATIHFIDKKYVMFLKDETVEPAQKNIRVATSNYLMKDYSKPGKPITGNYWAEGPTSIRIKDQWIVYFDKYRDHQMGAVASSDLVNWTDISDKVKFPEGVRHGTVFKVSKVVFDKLK
jgi:predicted GH43/DUF377 family glycosyl hydrolase